MMIIRFHRKMAKAFLTSSRRSLLAFRDTIHCLMVAVRKAASNAGLDTTSSWRRSTRIFWIGCRRLRKAMRLCWTTRSHCSAVRPVRLTMHATIRWFWLAESNLGFVTEPSISLRKARRWPICLSPCSKSWVSNPIRSQTAQERWRKSGS